MSGVTPPSSAGSNPASSSNQAKYSIDQLCEESQKQQLLLRSVLSRVQTTSSSNTTKDLMSLWQSKAKQSGARNSLGSNPSTPISTDTTKPQAPRSAGGAFDFSSIVISAVQHAVENPTGPIATQASDGKELQQQNQQAQPSQTQPPQTQPSQTQQEVFTQQKRAPPPQPPAANRWAGVSLSALQKSVQEQQDVEKTAATPSGPSEENRELEEVRKQNQQLHQSVQTLTTQHTTLQSKLEATTQQLNEALAQNKQLQENLQQTSQNQQQQLQTELSRAIAERDELSTREKQTQQSLAQTVSRCTQLEESTAQLTLELNQTKQQLAALVEQSTASANTAKQTTDSLQMQLHDAKAQTETLQAQLEQATANLQAQATQTEELKAQLKAAKTAEDSLRDELESSAARSDGFEAELARAQEQLHALANDSSLKQELLQANACVAELETEQTKLRSQLGEAVETAKKMESTHAAALLDVQSQSKEEIQNLNAQLQALRDNLAQETEALNTKLRQAHEEHTTHELALQSQLDAAKQRANDLENTHSTTVQQLETVSHDLALALERESALQQELVSTQQRLKLAETQQQQQQQHHASENSHNEQQLALQLENTNARIADMEVQLENTRQVLEDEKRALEATVESKTQQLTRLAAAIKKLSHDNQELVAKLEAETKEAESAKASLNKVAVAYRKVNASLSSEAELRQAAEQHNTQLWQSFQNVLASLPLPQQTVATTPPTTTTTDQPRPTSPVFDLSQSVANDDPSASNLSTATTVSRSLASECLERVKLAAAFHSHVESTRESQRRLALRAVFARAVVSQQHWAFVWWRAEARRQVADEERLRLEQEREELIARAQEAQEQVGALESLLADLKEEICRRNEAASVAAPVVVPETNQTESEAAHNPVDESPKTCTDAETQTDEATVAYNAYDATNWAAQGYAYPNAQAYDPYYQYHQQQQQQQQQQYHQHSPLGDLHNQQQAHDYQYQQQPAYDYSQHQQHDYNQQHAAQTQDYQQAYDNQHQSHDSLHAGQQHDQLQFPQYTQQDVPTTETAPTATRESASSYTDFFGDESCFQPSHSSHDGEGGDLPPTDNAAHTHTTATHTQTPTAEGDTDLHTTPTPHADSQTHTHTEALTQAHDNAEQPLLPAQPSDELPKSTTHDDAASKSDTQAPITTETAETSAPPVLLQKPQLKSRVAKKQQDNDTPKAKDKQASDSTETAKDPKAPKTTKPGKDAAKQSDNEDDAKPKQTTKTDKDKLKADDKATKSAAGKGSEEPTEEELPPRTGPAWMSMVAPLLMVAAGVVVSKMEADLGMVGFALGN